MRRFGFYDGSLLDEGDPAGDPQGIVTIHYPFEGSMSPLPRRTARRTLSALCALLFVGGCLWGGEGINAGDFNLVSIEEEWQMGRRLARRLQERLPLVQDGPAHRYVQQMGERIVEQTHLSDRSWAFHVVVNEEVNAFALPGGHIYVHTGLLRAASTPSELAGVLAHEIAHVTARHSTERLTKAHGINAFLGLITGAESGLVERLLTRVGRRGAIAKFSRDDEREADRLALDYLQKTARYDPRGMVRFFETLFERRRERPNVLEHFFASHPLTEERLQAARERIKQLPAADP